MIDVRITAYVSPVAEQPQASLTPVIHVVNRGDEDVQVTGLIRIYRESTGLMIYDSEIVPTALTHGDDADIAALTPFDPPAPADDDYFIKADITATSYLPGPPKTASLGAWYFDIKTPPMGEAPAGHHVTHELGGSDEIDATGLTGVGGGGVTDHGALTGLSDDDHPQYQLRDEVFYETDFLLVSELAPWSASALNSGTSNHLPAEQDHPGTMSLLSSTSANSGYLIRLDNDSLQIAGSESAQAIFKVKVLSGTYLVIGLQDMYNASLPVDGCYLMTDPATGKISGHCTANSSDSVTATDYQLVVDTWYRARVVLNSDASLATFYIWADDGTLLWSDTVNSDIPTGAGRQTGCAFAALNTGTSAQTLAYIDYLSLKITRALVR
jgi:hypothetical protein